jgi:hypothetical protein
MAWITVDADRDEPIEGVRCINHLRPHRGDVLPSVAMVSIGEGGVLLKIVDTIQE